MNLLKYSNGGFYLKIVSAILAALCLVGIIATSFYTHTLAGKVMCVLLALGNLIFAVLISISAFKEKNNTKPMSSIWSRGFLILFLLSTLLSTLCLIVFGELWAFTPEDTIFLYYILINIFMIPTTLRELFIKRIYLRTNP